jgi:uncharacterized protein YndB with AHSA1/START domain
MIETETPDDYVALTEAPALIVRRLLPAAVETVWAHLTVSDLRRRWLAAGDMDLVVGASFDLVWRNDDLTDPPGNRPEGFPGVHSNENRIVALERHRRLGFAFGSHGEVTIDIEQRGPNVLLTLIHTGVSDRSTLQMLGASWHNHLDLLATRLAGRTPTEPYWDKMRRLRADYALRIPA